MQKKKKEITSGISLSFLNFGFIWFLRFVLPDERKWVRPRVGQSDRFIGRHRRRHQTVAVTVAHGSDVEKYDEFLIINESRRT